MRLYVTPTFGRAVKKLHPGQKADLDKAVHIIANDPECGDAKVRDLSGVRVFKFRDLCTATTRRDNCVKNLRKMLIYLV